MGRKRRSIIIIILAVLGLSGVGAALFMLRAPVVMVVDDEFTGLYGLRRSRIKKLETSLRLFRPVRVVRVADGAQADVVAFAAAEAAGRPYAALFPAAYQEGARLYAEQAPDNPAGVLGGGRRANDGGPACIETDTKADFYRVGRCAALFALRSGGGILFFIGDSVNGDDREAFLRGLQDQGFAEPPLFVAPGETYTLPDRLSCVVMTRAEEDYLNTNPDIPAILFSWVDPGFSPREIKLIVDDSPWALAAAAARMIHRGAGALTPIASAILVPMGRIGDAELRRDIKKAIRGKVPD